MNRLLPLLCAVLCALPAWAFQGVSASGAWIREAPPGAAVMAGYVTLKNSTAQEQDICHARSDAFDSVEFHTMSMDHGQMQMRALERLVVPAHGSATLEPGGMHLMLMQPRTRLTAGQKVRIDFYCSASDKVSVEFEVRSGS